jgi:hypothetical protein
MYNLYEILGLTHTATQQEIKETYRVLAKRYHPDISKMANAEEKFIVITEAYEILRDPEIRRRYDLTAASPSPKKAKGRERYEDTPYRAAARKKAREASKKPYRKREHEYFDTYAAFLFPKMLVCFGLVLVAIVIMFIAVIILHYFGLDLGFVFFLWMILIPIISVNQINFNDWHNKRQTRKVRQMND